MDPDEKLFAGDEFPADEYWLRYEDSDGRVNTLIFPVEHFDLAYDFYNHLFESVLVERLVLFAVQNSHSLIPMYSSSFSLEFDSERGDSNG